MSLFHTIEPKDIWFGDHLYIWSSPLHQHHGIVLFVNSQDYDESEVLEFNTYDGSNKPAHAVVQKVSLKHFRKNCTLKRVVYGSKYARFKLAGTAYKFQSLQPEFVVDNAQHILEQVKFGECLIIPTDLTLSASSSSHYDLLLRNCECLAFWCKTGMWYSEQLEKVVDWIATPLVTFLKAVSDYLITKQIIPALGQEAMSEVIESSLCILKDKFCLTLLAEGIGNAIAFVIVELVKLIFRLIQYKDGQMTEEEFLNKTITSLVKGFTVGFFAFAIQALLTYFTFGTAALCPWIGGFVGSVIGSFVGNILGRFVVSGLAQLRDKQLSIID
ncbi:unnamed protein product [Rotaria sp. Silwood1]|nr:unnamed protein product [Rotaria sp. Silwood1]CAF1180513.1 unnamed protein product [Rotaria sp. Silwood1]CAF3435565.1 unnamed protein product [Rotaria sp. Silwood1]CAF3456466.1 unnamed protein product [Rotaria sp. Silwood1]CAF3480114.1 unnamed protein product [Rotaria sp. Silwood1]